MRKKLFMIFTILAVMFMFIGCKQDIPSDDFEATSKGTYQGLNNIEALYGMGSVTTSKLLAMENLDVVKGAKLANTSGDNQGFDLPDAKTSAVEVVQAQAEEFNQYFNMLSDFLDKADIKTTVEENKDQDEVVASYKFKLTITSKDEFGQDVTHVMYYSETQTANRETKNETYLEFSVEGVLKLEDVYYYIAGMRSSETEIDGKEEETEQTMWLKASLVKDDRSNYIIMEYENETENEGLTSEEEHSYKYSTYVNGRVTEVTEVSFEAENNEVEYEMEITTGQTRTKYEIEKVQKGNVTYLEVEYVVNNERGKFVIVFDGTEYYQYKFTKDASDDRRFDHYDFD